MIRQRVIKQTLVTVSIVVEGSLALMEIAGLGVFRCRKTTISVNCVFGIEVGHPTGVRSFLFGSLLESLVSVRSIEGQEKGFLSRDHEVFRQITRGMLLTVRLLTLQGMVH